MQPSLLETMGPDDPRSAGAARRRRRAGAVYMFCIPESNYVSGQVLVCGGGLLI